MKNVIGLVAARWALCPLGALCDASPGVSSFVAHALPTARTHAIVSTNPFRISNLLRSDQATRAGTCRSGIGRAANSRRHGRAIHRAHRFARLTRALSVAMPVFAYICRYSFEIRTNARRALSVRTQRERAHTRGRL